MEYNILKIDLDLHSKKKAVTHLRERLAYMHDLGFFSIAHIDTIQLIKKSSYGAKITLKCDLSATCIILFQSILGSDWRKEINTFINYYHFNMQYSNRLFTCKRYKDGSFKIAKLIDVTEEIKNFVSGDRKVYFN